MNPLDLYFEICATSTDSLRKIELNRIVDRIRKHWKEVSLRASRRELETYIEDWKAWVVLEFNLTNIPIEELQAEVDAVEVEQVETVAAEVTQPEELTVNEDLTQKLQEEVTYREVLATYSEVIEEDLDHQARLEELGLAEEPPVLEATALELAEKADLIESFLRGIAMLKGAPGETFFQLHREISNYFESLEETSRDSVDISADTLCAVSGVNKRRYEACWLRSRQITPRNIAEAERILPKTYTKEKKLEILKNALATRHFKTISSGSRQVLDLVEMVASKLAKSLIIRQPVNVFGTVFQYPSSIHEFGLTQGDYYRLKAQVYGKAQELASMCLRQDYVCTLRIDAEKLEGKIDTSDKILHDDEAEIEIPYSCFLAAARKADALGVIPESYNWKGGEGHAVNKKYPDRIIVMLDWWNEEENGDKYFGTSLDDSKVITYSFVRRDEYERERRDAIAFNQAKSQS